MIKCTSTFASALLLMAFFASPCRCQARVHDEDFIHPSVTSLEEMVQEQQTIISTLEASLQETMEIIYDLQQSRRLQQSVLLCGLEFINGNCVPTLPESIESEFTSTNTTNTTNDGRALQTRRAADFILPGRGIFRNGIDVSGGGGMCDDCINFRDDVTFDDNVEFSGPVRFDDPVTFRDDFTVEGRELEKRKDPEDVDDDLLDMSVNGFARVKFEPDEDEEFVVESKSRFEKNVFIEQDPDGKKKKNDEPFLFIEGELRTNALEHLD